MPRAGSFPASLLGLIESTSYPPLPNLEELELLRQALTEHRSGGAHAKRKRDEVEREREKAAVESNEKASRGLEAAERHRVGSVKGAGTASPGPGLAKVKKERSLSPSGSIGSSASFKPGSQQPITYAGIKKKKKRPLDSDDEGRERSVASPPTHHTTSTSGLKLKINKSRPVDPSPTPSSSAIAPIATTSTGGTIDFSLPSVPSRSLIPPRPGIQPPPQPGPKRQADVDEDFSNTKAPSQIAQPTFWSSVEPYLRDIREDDLAMLNFKADAPELFEIPARGRHYTEVWDEEDGNPPGTTSRVAVPALRQAMIASTQGQGMSHFVPAMELKDEHLVSESKGLGSLTERIVAGVLGRLKRESPPAKPDADKFDGNRDVGKVDLADMEDRMKRELKGIMLLGENEDYNMVNRDDDEVTAALRHCQRMLLEQTQINEARKARLGEISKHRLAFAEYQSSLDGLEKSIEAAWSKRVKKHGSAPKKIAASTLANGNGAGPTGRPPVPENVKKLVQVRKGWVDSVGRTMRERPRGEVLGLPTSSIYEGIGDELDEQVVEAAVGLSMDVDEE